MIPKATNFIPETIGDHVRKRRLELGVSQKEVATRIGVTSFTVLNWEKRYTTTIPVAVMPAIIAFLGYDPFPEPVTIGEELHAYRRKTGWSLKRLAEHLGVDESTVGNWERGGKIGSRKHQLLASTLLRAANRI